MERVTFSGRQYPHSSERIEKVAHLQLCVAWKIVPQNTHEVMFLGRQRLHAVRIAAKAGLGRADEHVTVPRHDKDRATVPRAFDVEDPLLYAIAYDDVRSLDQLERWRRDARCNALHHPLHPRSRRIDQYARRALLRRPRVRVADDYLVLAKFRGEEFCGRQ